MTTAILPSARTVDPLALLMPANPSKDHKSRIARFCRWLRAEGTPWHAPDLEAYRDHLLDEGKAPATVSAHLSTVRARYREVARDNKIRDRLYERARLELQELGQDDTPANRRAMVAEALERLDNATDPENAPVKQTKKQDEAEGDHLRLTKAQADALLAAPGVDTLQGLRDTAMIAVLLCTGLREAELAALDVADLRQRLGDELALVVRHGKGDKQRLVPWGDLSWALAIVDKWLAAAGITEGAVFRGFWRGGRKVRPGRLTTRAVQLVLAAYPIAIDGELRTAKPHDLRRTYARRLYEAGVDLVAIQQNLGHADVKTTLGYIGALGAEARRAPSVYTFDLGKLQNVIA